MSTTPVKIFWTFPAIFYLDRFQQNSHKGSDLKYGLLTDIINTLEYQ